MAEEKDEGYALVARKACFGLPTGCPDSLPVYIYLRLAKFPFEVRFNLNHPDSDHIPYVESGPYAAFNNEKGGVIESLKEDGIIDLDSGLPVQTIPEWLSTKALITSSLADAVMYELWVEYDTSPAHTIYYSDLPFPIGKILHFQKTRQAKQVLRITKLNSQRREAEIYRRANIAYEALSTMIGEEKFFLDNRPTSLDALFLGHALFTLRALPETSLLRRQLLLHENLVRYSENLEKELLLDSSAVSESAFDPSSSTPRKPPSSWRTRTSERKAKREKTEEEKKFRKRAKYFLATQFIAIVVFVSLFGGGDDGDIDMEDDDEIMD